MDEKSQDMLEFPKVREIIAGYTSFPASRELALSLQPSSDPVQVSLWLRQCSEVRRLLAFEPDLQTGAIDDVREQVELAARGKVLEPTTLATIAATLVSTRLLKNKLNKLSSEYPLLWDIAQNITDLRTLEKNINNCISPAGELQDTASRELQALRHQIQSHRQQLVTNLESIIGSPRGQKIIQEPIITQREGRYVIPVKIESKKELRGIIHDISNTGATAFIEPWEVIDQGNELREIINEEKREIERILRQLSTDVGTNTIEISNNIALISEIDLIFAKAKYARRNNASEAITGNYEDSGMPPTLRLLDARHPLLGNRAVPLSVEIGKDFTVLVITGPNTGGKTVALKTIGLLSLMTLAGLPIPAHEESRIPIFDNIFVDIGDEQSIEQTLSTFSWHITNISRIIENSTDHSLVLLDELGTSTDPVEGSALARAILLQFLSKSTKTIATTHLGDLKAFAYMTDGLQNASLDFDPVTFTPTYRLSIGLPGGSNALETAARLGLDPIIIEDARSMLSAGTIELEALITSLNEELSKTKKFRQELETEKTSAEQLTRNLEKELRELKTKEKTIIQEARDRVVKEGAELQREIKQASSELRKQKSRDNIERTRKALASVHDRLKSETWKTQTAGENQGIPIAAISPGDTVWLKDANLEAKVIQIDETSNEIEVQAGKTHIKLGLEGIDRMVPAGAGEERKFIPIVKPQPKQIPMELLLLGKRAEEVEYLLNSYLDDAVMANLRQVRIVHGSGTGVLRQIVRDLLSSHPLVKSFRPGEHGEGGNGVTVVRL